MRILLVDDSAIYYEEFAQLLKDSGIKYSALDYASTADEGARLMASGMHDIYFVDYRLPGSDGLTLLRQARGGGLARPLVLLTAYDSPEVDAAAEDAGANDYLTKGEFSAAMLGRAIRYARRNSASVQAAKEAEGRFVMAQEAANIGTWDWDVRTNMVIWSPRMFGIYGVDPTTSGDALYGVWLQAVLPDDRDSAQAVALAALAGQAPLNSLYRIRRPDPARPEVPAAIRWISCKGDVVRDASGSPIRMVGINVDVTEQQDRIAALHASRNQAVAGMQISELRFQAYFESAPDCMFHVRREPDGRFVYEAVNPVGLAAAGATLEMLRGRTPEEILGPDKGGAMTAGLRRVYETGQPHRYEPTWTMASGPVTYDAVYLPLRDHDAIITGVLGIARDVTEHRRMQAELHQAQKMEALGQLAGGIAHDFNNLLTGVLGCFELLSRHATADAAKRFIAQGIRAVERGTALTGRLLAFSRHQPLETQAVDVNASLDETGELLTRTLGGTIRVGKRFATDLWPASADRNQLELAILNLAINARDAMPLGGTLTIETRNETVSAMPEDGVAAGDYVVVAITDTGSGMTAEVLERVLEPFYTTKDVGRGTGLGLSMVHSVVQQLGGDLRITSEPGKGTCVTLYLRRATLDIAVTSEAPLALSARASILLVDDDPDVQTVVTAYAAECGHSVIVAVTAADVLAVLEGNQAVDLLIADRALPGAPFDELVAQARSRRPGLPALLVSAKPEAARSDVPGAIPVLAKPFRKDAFNNAIAALLADVAAPSTSVVPFRPSRA
jgi:PAS domain S-box-containing protein